MTLGQAHSLAWALRSGYEVSPKRLKCLKPGRVLVVSRDGYRSMRTVTLSMDCTMHLELSELPGGRGQTRSRWLEYVPEVPWP